MKTNVIAIRIPSRLYYRQNDEAEIAGCLMGIISALLKLRYSEDCAGLINNYNFIEIPNAAFFEQEIVPTLAKFLEMPEESYFNLLEVVCIAELNEKDYE